MNPTPVETIRPAQTPSFIPVCEPVLDGREREYVLDCLDTNWVSSLGQYITRFEETFSAFCDARHGVACSSGTAALHLALEALDVGPGDEVIIPAFTLIVSANTVCMTGATPVLADVDPLTWCIDPAAIERKITPRTRAIVVVHMYGHPVDMNAVMRIARKHDLRVIEDGAQAHGALCRGRKVGSIGDVGAFSFYGNKIITTGEGGIVVTDDDRIAERARLLRNQAFTSERFVHHAVGYNYRMTNVQAAIGLAQCERLEAKIARKIDIARIYSELLSDEAAAGRLTLPRQEPWARNVYWMYGLLVGEAFGRSRDELRTMLADRGVDTRSFFHPLNRQPVYQGDHPRWPDLRGTYPVSEDLGERGLYLPSGLSITPDVQREVVARLLDCRP
ncbi:MAG TPA: DegT/DnrJ/EryC1/StrS family aminotransferase [Phycisphaerae bacterium]|nr:DegT/DnrJ/EryC1/StrS family aminotransferase [Phycisphaerae bacterium]